MNGNAPTTTSAQPEDPAERMTAGTGATGEEYQRIEQVAARTGLTKRTLRYYEEIGLLPAPTRTEGGYRLYSEQDVQHLLRIKRLRDLLGFSLAEIREIAELEEYRERAKAAWEQSTDPQTRLDALDRAEEVTRRHLNMVAEKLAGLEEMRHALNERMGRYKQTRSELRAQLANTEAGAPVQ